MFHYNKSNLNIHESYRLKETIQYKETINMAVAAPLAADTTD